MSILRSVDPDGTKYYFESDGKLTIKKTENTNPILENNKRSNDLKLFVISERKLNKSTYWDNRLVKLRKTKWRKLI